MIQITFEIDPTDVQNEYWRFNSDGDPALNYLFAHRLQLALDSHLPWAAHNLDFYETED